MKGVSRQKEVQSHFPVPVHQAPFLLFSQHIPALLM